MQVSYDMFDRLEKPALTLCNPDKVEIYSLSMAYNVEYVPRFNAVSELTFTIPKTINENTLDVYNYIVIKRLIKVEGIGYFEIISCPEDSNGAVDIKNVHAVSTEFKMSKKRLTGFGGTYQFYDAVSPSGTLLQEIVDLLPSWSIGSVDATVSAKFRTFDVQDTNIYNFLMNDVSNAYECIFTFDTINNTIRVDSVDSAVTQTDIFLSFDNLLKQAKLKEMDDEITTALSVYGGGNLTIRSVNPLGTATIYDFSYYKNTDWMSQNLIDKLNAWEALVTSYESTYASTLTTLKTYYEDLIVLEGELTALLSTLAGLEQVLASRIQQGLETSDIKSQIDSQEALIDSKNIEIVSKQGDITTLQGTLTSINDTVSFESNFTAGELAELSEFTFENTYQNENIIQTDIMTDSEKQDQSQLLYDQGKSVLSRISQPRYVFETESVNFLAMKEFESFSNDLDVGSSLTVELPNGQITTSIILEVKVNYDNPDKFSLVLSNRLRSDSSAYVFSDLFGQINNLGATVSFNKQDWGNWNDNHKDEVTTFISSALNATVNKLISTTDQDVIIDGAGLRGRQWNGSAFDDKQVWLTNNVLAFTDDSWATAKVALGDVSVGGVSHYGLVAETIVGNLIAGNTLTIQNEDLSFVVDATGVSISNGNISLETDYNRVFIDPTNGIKIQTNVGGSWVDKFYADGSGNLVFTGDLSGATGTFSGSITAGSGTIGGWNINSNSLYDNLGNYIRSNGQVKLGALTIDGGTASFSGTIYADNIYGTINGGKIGSGINASNVTLGSMSGSRIYGGAIGGTSGYQYMDGGNMFFDLNGGMLVEANSGITLSAGGVFNAGGNTFTNIYSGGRIDLNPSGSLTINGYYGMTTVFVAGSIRFYFRKGLLYGWGYAI